MVVLFAHGSREQPEAWLRPDGCPTCTECSQLLPKPALIITHFFDKAVQQLASRRHQHFLFLPRSLSMNQKGEILILF